MYTFENLQTELIEKTEVKSSEFRRLFHGRGGCFEGWEFLTVDSIDGVLNVAYYDAVDDAVEAQLHGLFEALYTKASYAAVVLQRRYLPKAPSEVVFGHVPQKVYAIENEIAYALDLLNNQNSGFFPDMKIGREFVYAQAQGKRVLNLFAYTCAFSVVALKGGASSVVNVDMNKRVLETGRKNHRLNGVEVKGTRYMPYNILKSFSRIKKAGPYDLIVIDPPSFQKGSFAATKDYQKIIRRLNELASQECIVLSCLNSPALDSAFIVDLFKEEAPSFTFVKRLENMESFPNRDSERALKTLVFQNF